MLVYMSSYHICGRKLRMVIEQELKNETYNEIRKTKRTGRKM
jgi:hypothetical protein